MSRPQTPSSTSAVYRLLIAISFLVATHAGLAETSATGTIQGRVSNSMRGEYLERVRVSIDGTVNETFTDALGQYRLSNVAPGVVTIRAFRTGLMVETTPANVASGQIAQVDFDLAESGTREGNTAVQLDKLEVNVSREMDGAALAINEQRFAADIRTVVTANEFGPKGEGGIGEVLQYIPGMSIVDGNGITSFVEMNGVPSDYVPVRVNGFDLASGRETTGRPVMLGVAPTTHSLSRIEVLNSPTPESPGAALAGSINMVPLSAFERSKPVFRSSAFVTYRDTESLTLRKTPSPGVKPTYKVQPGFNFSYIRPVNSRFGFTLSGGYSRQSINSENVANTWRGVGTVTNGTAFPDTSADKPYLSAYTTTINGVDAERRSLAATFDYKLGPNDRISFSLNYMANAQGTYGRTLGFTINNVVPGTYGPTGTKGAVGAGTISLALATRVPTDKGYMPNLVYHHDGPIWKAEAGIGHSQSQSASENASRGMFFSSTASRNNVTISFDEVSELRPGAITVTDGTTGEVVNPYNLNSYVLTNAAYITPDLAGVYDFGLQQSAYFNLAREFLWRVPVTLKTGFDVRRQMRDIVNGARTTFSYVGPDGRTSTNPAGSDDLAGIVLDPINSQIVPGFGFPAIQWQSDTRLYDLYKSSPSYFSTNDATTYNSGATNSKYAEEVISSIYLRGDVRLFRGRLRLVGGLRAEQTNVEAEGPLTDPTGNFQRDAAGKVIRGANGQPVPIETDPVAIAKRTLLTRGMKAKKEYLRLFPSINAGLTIRENLIARAAYYYSVGRPNFNQYAGGVSLPNTEAIDQTNLRITVNNAAIKAWSAQTARASLEYYFQQVGIVSIGVWHREFENFFGSTVFPATPQFLALYDLDPAVYGRYDVSTQYNLPDAVEMRGVDLSYKQALTFLPHWARGVQVFANMSTVRAKGPASANFSNAVPRIYNGGISLSRKKYNLRLNWNYRSETRLSLVAEARGVAASTYRIRPEQLRFNCSTEYQLNRHVGLFATFSDAVENDVEIAGPLTPAVARLNTRVSYGGLWTVGLNGTF